MALHRLGRIVPCLLTALVGLCLVASRAPGVTEVVARAYDPPPTGDGYFQEFAPPVLNAEGQTVFWASLLNAGYVLEAGIYRGESSIGTLTQIARESPAGLLEHGLNDLASRPAINASGEIAFLATYLPPQVSGGADLRSVYEGSGGALSLIASEGANSPDGNGFLGAYFGDPAFNDAGEAAFQNVLTGTSGGSADDNGLFRGDGATLTQIARELPAGPSSGGLTGLGPPAINASGEVVFRATYLQPLLAGGASRRGLYRGSGGAIIPVATEGDAAPIANAFFGGVGGFGDPSFNDAGDVAFFASLVGTGVGPNSDSAIFRSSAGTVARIVREGDTAPDGDGVFSLLHSPRLNASGQTVFSGFLTDTFSTPSRNMGIFSSSGESVTQIARKWAPDPGGIPFLSFGNPEINVFGQVAFLASVLDETFSFVQHGIFLANGIDTIDVARTTSVDHRIAGQLIDELQVADAGVPHGSGRSWFNDEGQVAYLATLSDGRQVVVRYTIPLPKWTLPGSGHWAVNQNWSNGIVPNSFHDAAIDPPASVVVTGPSENSFVKSLSIGAGSGEAVLLLDNGGDLTALQQVTIHDRGRMVVGRRHTLAAETLSNHGVLTGDGFVLAQLANETAGEVRVAAGESLVVMASAPHTNRGTMEVVGGAMEFIGWVHNTESANLAASEGATFRFQDGLANDGAVALGGGMNRVFGDVNNIGRILVSNHSTAIFSGEVVNGGTMNVAPDSAAVFSNGLSGHGVGGGGSVNLHGKTSPGASTGAMIFGGDVQFGAFSELEVELGGTSAGRFDTVEIGGMAWLGEQSTLMLLPHHEFVPAAGDVFAIMTWQDGLVGAFDDIAVHPFFSDRGISFVSEYVHPQGVGWLQVRTVPEPAIGWLSLMAVCLSRRLRPNRT